MPSEYFLIFAIWNTVLSLMWLREGSRLFYIGAPCAIACWVWAL